MKNFIHNVFWMLPIPRTNEEVGAIMLVAATVVAVIVIF